ncbi:oxidoreductase CipA-like protein [Exophiala viscosa]|uniref:oxidoreductase CipA-like protein n=1 Tax=Exophiala viscosa TaxID=2486360 RepID=UPI00219AAA1A|nr:oxidoreductase CipA-like protein [Exophiala viscosa]
MAVLRKVVQVGATGNLGAAVLESLISTPSLEVTVLSREGSSSRPVRPEEVNVITADYGSVDSLSAAFQGADVVVVTVGASGLASQARMIEAAIRARVRRFIPSEFGADTLHEKARGLPVYRAKVETLNLLKAKAAEGLIEWTAVFGGPFLDWGLSRGLFGFEPAAADATFFDGGSTQVSTSRLTDIGQAIIGILQNPSKTANIPIYIQSTCTSQKQLLELAERTLGKKYKVTNVSTEQMEKAALEKMKQGDMSGMRAFLVRAIFAPDYGCNFTARLANDLVGVKELSPTDLAALVDETLRQTGQS